MADGGHDDAVGARPVALVTGVGRTRGIGAGIARRLAAGGWDLALTYWGAYDERMPWGPEPGAPAAIAELLRAEGAQVLAVEANLSDPAAPALVLDRAAEAFGEVQALVLCHCESVDSGLLDTTVESFDRHVAVNARATWLLLREFGLRARGADDRRRIVALTSDHVVGNVPYGASKGALDRIVLAAAREFAHLGVRANVVNPGPVDTGWMSEEIRESGARRTPLGRVGTPRDVAEFVAFLCSPQGGWVNGRLLTCDGGFSA
ncbi:SDR family oxidoreductase [Kineococcus sp. NUM-3379]